MKNFYACRNQRRISSHVLFFPPFSDTKGAFKTYFFGNIWICSLNVDWFSIWKRRQSLLSKVNKYSVSHTRFLPPIATLNLRCKEIYKCTSKENLQLASAKVSLSNKAIEVRFTQSEGFLTDHPISVFSVCVGHYLCLLSRALFFFFTLV